MKNPFLKRLYLFNRNGTHWGIDYCFEPSDKLNSLFEGLKAHQQLSFVPTPEGGIDWKIVEDEPPGWRLHVGSRVVYLLVESTTPRPPREAVALAGKLHLQLLAMRLYNCQHNDILEYWRKPDDEFNRAEDYAAAGALDRSIYLAELIKVHCPAARSALEVGCNIGRNLNHLHERLDFEVAGIEISGHALELLKTTYPSIADAELYEGDAAERISEIADHRYDLVYSMAVLMHIHPDAPASLWENIVRVAGRYIITIENESLNSDRNWVRNYEEVFGPFGAIQIHTEIPTIPAFGGYRTRIFSVSHRT